jgi:hypothetical protein
MTMTKNWRVPDIPDPEHVSTCFHVLIAHTYSTSTGMQCTHTINAHFQDSLSQSDSKLPHRNQPWDAQQTTNSAHNSFWARLALATNNARVTGGAE